MATLVGNPIDVVKTRVMAGKRQLAAGAPGSNSRSYAGAIDCIVQTMRNEGPAAFYQGVAPQFVRITAWNIVMFVSCYAALHSSALAHERVEHESYECAAPTTFPSLHHQVAFEQYKVLLRARLEL